MNFPTTSKRDKDYHHDYAKAIISNSITDGWAHQYRLMEECYKFYDEGSAGELTSHLQKAEDGTDLPSFWITLNTLKTKIDLMIGELEQRGSEIKVKAINKEAVYRKIEEKEKLRVMTRLSDLISSVQEQTGIQLEDLSNVPESEAELDEYFDLTFKDKVEIIMESALKFCGQYNKWTEERKSLFRDILAVGRCFVRNEIHRGVPRAKRVSPLCMIFDTNSVTDDLSDCNFYGEVQYMSLAEAVEKYGLTEDEIEEAKASYNDYRMNGANSDRFAYISDNRLQWFNNINDQTRVLVIRAVWRDYKVTNYKEDKNPNGSMHLQEVEKIRNRDKDKVFSKRKELWRQCTVIGGQIVKEWGEVPNQGRDLSDLERSESPYKGWIPNFGIGRGVSKTEQLVGLQLLKDITMYNIQNAMARAGGRGFVYDLAMLPPNWSPETAMKYLKVHGIAYINSKESQLMPGNMNLFREFDLSLSASVSQYLQIMQYIDNEMAAISGISPERQGMIQGASQGVGVTQSAVFQSNLVTTPLFNGFERFCSSVLNYQAKLIKIAWAGKERFAPIIGDTGIDFLKNNIDIDLDTYAVVEAQAPQVIDRQKLEGMLNIVLQSDPEFIDDALQIMLEPDTKMAIRKFQKKRYLRKAEQAMQQQQQMMMQQQQMQMQQQQLMLQQQAQDKRIQGDLQLQQVKNDGSLQRTLAQGRVRLNERKLDALKGM